MKRTVFMKSICISLVLLTLFALPTAAARANLDREQIPVATRDAAVLNKLGIMLGTEEGLELEREVTRAEALLLISRTAAVALTDEAYDNPFDDVSEKHWAYRTICGFYRNGLIDGVSERLFEPDRGVTGKEFAKILLSCMGYDGVTIENAFEIGEKADLLNDNFSRSNVYGEYTLTRGECARLCRKALLAYTADSDKKMLYTRLIENGSCTYEDFNGLLWSGTPAEKKQTEFGDKIASYMPDDKNYMISPLSIKSALALVANGASGQTRQELLEACGAASLEAVNDSLAQMIQKYSETNVLSLGIANSLWFNTDRSPYKFKPEYTDKMGELFGASAEEVNNSDAVERINAWASEKTNGKISSAAANNDFWTYLANAVYFKATWRDPFFESNTAKAVFTDRNGIASELDFMNKTAYMPYYESADGGVRAVKRDYTNTELIENGDGSMSTERHDDIDVSMYLILADDDIKPIQTLRAMHFDEKYVKLSMPKLECSFEMRPHEILAQMGVTKAFEPSEADFAQMVTGEGMYITDSVHKTYIKIDERGTEAAAVTAFAGGSSSDAEYPEPIEFMLNRPFYYVIMDNINGEILFMGEYAFAE